jgi:hypothetical protein
MSTPKPASEHRYELHHDIRDVQKPNPWKLWLKRDPCYAQWSITRNYTGSNSSLFANFAG